MTRAPWGLDVGEEKVVPPEVAVVEVVEDGEGVRGTEIREDDEVTVREEVVVGERPGVGGLRPDPPVTPPGRSPPHVVRLGVLRDPPRAVVRLVVEGPEAPSP